MKKTLLAMILAVISSMVMAKSEAEQFGLKYIETPPGDQL